MQRAGDGSAGGGGVTAPGPKSLLGISCWDGSAPSPRKLPDPWPTKLSPNPHRVPTILVAGRDLVAAPAGPAVWASEPVWRGLGLSLRWSVRIRCGVQWVGVFWP